MHAFLPIKQMEGGQAQGHRAMKDGKGASADGAGGGGWGEGGGGGGLGGDDDDGEVSGEAIGAFVSGLLTVLCSCVGQMLELTNREVKRGVVERIEATQSEDVCTGLPPVS